jgi:hypothetical protein
MVKNQSESALHRQQELRFHGTADTVRSRLSQPFSEAAMNVGDKLIIAKDIFDDGEDHHPPGYCARAGDEVIVRYINATCLAVSHEGVVDSTFAIYPDEYKVKETS